MKLKKPRDWREKLKNWLRKRDSRPRKQSDCKGKPKKRQKRSVLRRKKLKDWLRRLLN